MRTLRSRSIGREIRAILTARTVIAARLARGGLVLRPLRAKAKALELGQVDFIETRRRVFLRSVVVHVVGGKRARARVVAWSEAKQA